MRQRRPRTRSRAPRKLTPARRATRQLKRWHRAHCVADAMPLRAFAELLTEEKSNRRAVAAGWLERKGLRVGQ